MSSLLAQLSERAGALGRRAIAEMYADPFWAARFGERGRALADRDGDYHVSYLLQALEARDPSVLTRYARWLQSVLVSRGMCSRHLAESFSRLAQALRQEVPGSEPALGLLDAAIDALTYEAGPARELALAARELAPAVAQAVASPSAPAGSTARARLEAELLDHIAYLGDALHAERPELFVAHVRWLQGFVVARGAHAEHVAQSLSALRDALAARGPGGVLSADVEASALPVIAAALDALRDVESAPAPSAPGSTP